MLDDLLEYPSSLRTFRTGIEEKLEEEEINASDWERAEELMKEIENFTQRCTPKVKQSSKGDKEKNQAKLVKEPTPTPIPTTQTRGQPPQ